MLYEVITKAAQDVQRPYASTEKAADNSAASTAETTKAPSDAQTSQPVVELESAEKKAD